MDRLPDLPAQESADFDLLDLALPLLRHWHLIVLGPIIAGLLCLGGAFLITPTFTARTVILPPQQQQSSTSALIGQIASLGLGSASVKSPADQYIALMQSTTVLDRLIDRFKLMEVYEAKYRHLVRKSLTAKTEISLSKRGGLITVEVDDTDPVRAAEIANAYVEELRTLTDRLALSEAQQRRAFFEGHLKNARDGLVDAQRALGASGFGQGALKAEPKAAAENYARMRAELTAAEVKLQALRGSLTDNNPEVQTQQALVAALRSQLAAIERSTAPGSDADYVSKYREFKYQEALFEMFARQYELARVDESREGALIQVVDPALPPEWKSKPSRLTYGLVGTLVALVVLVAWILMRDAWSRASQAPRTADKIRQLRLAFKRR